MNPCHRQTPLASRFRDAAETPPLRDYQDWSKGVYRGLVGGHEETSGELTEWAKYLKSIQDRPGWSVARLARVTGMHRSTLFRMIAGETENISTQKVLAIAEAAGDPPAVALRAAADLLTDDEPYTPAPFGLDRNDPVVQKIMSLDVDDEIREHMLNRHRANLAHDQERYLAQLDEDEKMFGKRRGNT